MPITYVNAPLYSKSQYGEAFKAHHDEILIDPDVNEDLIERLFKVAHSRFNHIIRNNKGQISPDKAADEAFEFAEKQIECHNPKLSIAISVVLVIIIIVGIIVVCIIKK